MDEFRIKIINFFNTSWLKSIKSKYLLYLSPNIGELRFHYNRVFGTQMSVSQVCEFLIEQELERIKEMPNYSGEYLDTNLTKVRTETVLIKRSKL